MDLTSYVSNLGREFATLAEAGGDEARALVERLTGSLESAIRMTLLDALSAAADEITRDLAPGSVELRLRGGAAGMTVPNLMVSFYCSVIEGQRLSPFGGASSIGTIG